LCLRFLEQQDAGELKRKLAFAEEDMRRYSDACAAEKRDAAQRKKTPRRPPASDATPAEWPSAHNN
jgi:hypothetical protein